MGRSWVGRPFAEVGASTVLVIALLSQAGTVQATREPRTGGQGVGSSDQTTHQAAVSGHTTRLVASAHAAQPRGSGARSTDLRTLFDKPPRKPAFGAAKVNQTLDQLEAAHVALEAAAQTKVNASPHASPPLTPVLATDSGRPAAALPIAVAGEAHLGSGGDEPPNSSVAAGPDDVLQVTNQTIQVANRSGLPLGSAALIDFFNLHPNGAPNTTFQSAPRVHFDTAHQRWIATEVAWDCGTDVFLNDTAKFGHGYLDYAISDTSDPLGSWTDSYYFWNDFLPDQPSSGASSDKLALASNLFAMGPGGAPSNPGCASGPFSEENFILMDWAQLGPHYSVAKLSFFDGGDDSQDALKVASGDTDPSPALRLIGSANGTFAGDTPGDVILIGITGSVAHNTLSFAGFNATLDGVVASFEVPPDPHQLGGSGLLTSVIDGGPDSVTYRGGGLTLSSTYPCQPDGDTQIRDCMRVLFLSDPDVTADPGEIGDTLLAADGFDISFGAVATLGDGSLVAVYTESSTTSDPTSYERHNLISDTWLQWSAQHLLTASAHGYAGTRWGSYLGIAADPQDANAAWVGDPYVIASGDWSTSLHEVSLDEGSGYFPISPVRVLSSRDGIGLTGAFSSNTPRTFAVAGIGGVPLNADAITGNLTVTGQTAAGYVSLTPDETANPASSTLNFPLGDNRANNATIALSPGGSLSAVYKAAAGEHVNLILDVTGYFLRGSGQHYFTMTPTRILDSRLGLGAATFHANVAQAFEVHGIAGIPAEATAITANLTVTSQTKSGYVSLTPTPDDNPTTSTINFPVGDTRANGLTIPIGPDGTVAAVYKASTGTANLILDVTGYYSAGSGGPAPGSPPLLFHALSPGRQIDTRQPLGGGDTGNAISGAQGIEPRNVGIGTHFGVPPTAMAITGNLTVTGQTGAGFVTLSPDANAAPSTSTINFPLGDTRANGVTVPLDSGSLSLVYRPTAGKTVQIILDITGYFQ